MTTACAARITLVLAFLALSTPASAITARQCAQLRAAIAKHGITMVLIAARLPPYSFTAEQVAWARQACRI